MTNVGPLSMAGGPGTGSDLQPLMHAVHQPSQAASQVTAQQNTSSGAYVGVLQGQPSESVSDEDWRMARELAAGFLLGFAATTRDAYRGDLQRFAEHCLLMGISPLKAGRRDIEGYIRSLEGRYAPKTVARRLSALAGFYKYVVEEEVLPRSPMLRVRRPKGRQQAQKLGLDRDEAVALLCAAREDELRSELVVSILVLHGLRVSELTAARVEDLMLVRGFTVLTVTRKGGRQQQMPLAEPVARVLHVYLHGRRTGPLVLSRTGRALDRANVNRLLKRLGGEALPDRPDLSAHTLRHTAISLALDAGVSLRDVQDGAGHASPSTTRAYDDARRALERHPAARLAVFLADT